MSHAQRAQDADSSPAMRTNIFRRFCNLAPRTKRADGHG
jgi:hypothetical protein